jgi:hypothetical protein
VNPIHNTRATLGNGIDMNTGNYGMVLFPQGLQYSAIDYDLGAAYITAETTAIEPCFEFIKYASERPDIYEGIPARPSVLDSDLIHRLESDETITFYRSVHDLLRQSNTIEFPYAGTQDSVVYADGFVSVWLLRVMSRYLLEDANLEEELREAEEFTLAYLECVATIPPFDPTSQTTEDYVNLYRNCFIAIDPTI